MSKSKRPQIPKRNEVCLVRSSTAEYLTCVATTGNAQSSVKMRYEDENLWLTQKMMAALYDVSVPIDRGGWHDPKTSFLAAVLSFILLMVC